MSSLSDSVIVLAVKRTVIAFNKADGTRLWSTKLVSGLGDDFVTVLADTTRVYAHTRGEMFCLDLATGAILWQDSLSGLGYGIASIALPGSSAPQAAVIAQIRRQQEASGSASSVHTGSST